MVFQDEMGNTWWNYEVFKETSNNLWISFREGCFYDNNSSSRPLRRWLPFWKIKGVNFFFDFIEILARISDVLSPAPLGLDVNSIPYEERV